MAALRPSRILLLDEHTAALDPRTAQFVLDLTARIVSESRLTNMMVTHSMRQALDVGERTVLLHQGNVVLDVSGPERQGLDVPDLLNMFQRVRGEKLSDDGLLQIGKASSRERGWQSGEIRVGGVTITKKNRNINRELT